MNHDQIVALLKLVYGDDGFYCGEPAAHTLSVAICEALGIALPRDGGPDPVGMWCDVPTPMIWEGEEVMHAEPVDLNTPCERCLNE